MIFEELTDLQRYVVVEFTPQFDEISWIFLWSWFH